MVLRMEARIENVDSVIRSINKELARLGCPKKAITRMDIAIDEVFANVCHYAYGGAVGDVTIYVEEQPDQGAVHITFEDAGIPFDPLAHEDPDVTLGVHDRKIGGLGIFMVKRIMDAVRYEHVNGKNRFTMTKNL